MPNEQPGNPIEAGSVIGTIGSRYRLEAVEAESEAAIVYRAASLQPDWYGYDDRDRVGDAVFVVVLRQSLRPSIQASPDPRRAVQKEMRRAMMLVDPAVAGFPEWNKLRVDDPVKLSEGEIGSIPWGAFQVSTYRRRLLKLVADYRRPSNFSNITKRSILEAAENRCNRCASEVKLEVDHIIPFAFGGTNRQTNGMVLCSSCHLEKSRAERKAFGLSADQSQKLGNYAAETFQDPSMYLQALEQQTGWSLSLDE